MKSTTVSKFAVALAAGLSLSAMLAEAAFAQDGKKIGVSWRHFQEERWKIDEAGIKSVLEPAGYTYVSADAQADPVKQLADIESLIASDVDALIILAQDSKAVLPAIAQAKAAGIPVIAYDAPIDTADTLFVSFDNVAVGHLMAEAMVKAKPKGNYALIEGDAAHPIVGVFRQGQMEVLKPLIDSGAVKIVAQQNIENWRPDGAQAAVDQILTANNNAIDAVMAMNDGMAGGSAAALAAQGLTGVALSGQDGETAALNRIAQGLQTVTIWKDSKALGVAAATAAIELASGTALGAVKGSAATPTESAGTQPAILLEPIAITADNLNVVLDANWITKEALCAGVGANGPAVCK